MYGPQICHSRDRLYGPDVVEGEFNWQSAEEVVQAYSIANESATGLEQNVRMKYAGIGGYANALENSLNGGLINLVGEHAVDFWRNRW